ncbi:MAG: trypsin-like serine protease, partial [Myxococcales bacterium]|nr:trypsin-like serine protease [Myxococcales bacterium]
MDARLAILVGGVLLVGCSVPEAPGERVLGDTQPIIGGVLDNWRAYVVGVGNTQGTFCTGTVISQRTVLTAGHCFQGISRVYFGHDVSMGNNPPSVAVVTKRRHQDYSSNTLANDLSVLELAQDSPVQPAPLLRETMANTPAYIGPDFAHVGYGDDGNGGYDIRRVVTFPIIAVGPANVGLQTGTGPIDATMYFYAQPGKNTCFGDSGGPAFVPRGLVEHVAGTTSFGDPNCAIDGVDARADLPQINAFIQSWIDQWEGLNNPCRSNGTCDETCNVNNTLVDPDCAQNHCSADGMCVLSCVNPIDPDCMGAVDYCGPDGACDPSCNPVDVDCLAEQGGSGGAPPVGGAGGAGATGTGGAGATGTGGAGATGTGGA